MRPVTVIVALAENGVIGRDNGLAWHQRSDLKRFRALTMGGPMIMGRRTYQSIGKPLPGRETVVLTRDAAFTAPGIHVAHDLAQALGLADAIAGRMGAAALPVCGGAEIYAQALPLAQRLHLTLVHATPEGDVTFPPFDRGAFVETRRESHPAGEGDDHPFTFIDLERRRPDASR